MKKIFIYLLLFLITSCNTLYFDSEAILISDNKVKYCGESKDDKVKCYDINGFIDGYIKTDSYKNNSIKNTCDNYGGYNIQFYNGKIYSISKLSEIPSNHISGYIIGSLVFICFYGIWFLTAQRIYDYRKENTIKKTKI
jgi:hypothetical protein